MKAGGGIGGYGADSVCGCDLSYGIVTVGGVGGSVKGQELHRPFVVESRYQARWARERGPNHGDLVPIRVKQFFRGGAFFGKDGVDNAHAGDRQGRSSGAQAFSKSAYAGPAVIPGGNGFIVSDSVLSEAIIETPA